MRPLLETFKTKARSLKQETYTLYLAYRHPSTPWYARSFAAIVVAYAFSPIVLVPDFIPILGYLDDLILVPMGIALALKMIQDESLTDARSQSEKIFKEGQPRKWAAGAVIIIWLELAVLGILSTLRWTRNWSVH